MHFHSLFNFVVSGYSTVLYYTTKLVSNTNYADTVPCNQLHFLAFILVTTGCEDALTYVLASDNRIETRSEQVRTTCPSDAIWAL
jgi:hypothetical protein